MWIGEPGVLWRKAKARLNLDDDAPPPFRNITYINGGSAVAPSSTTGITMAISGAATGDVVVAIVNVNATTNLTMTEASGTWTKTNDSYIDDTNDCNTALFYKVMGAVPDTSVTFGGTVSSFHWSSAYHVYRNVDPVVLDTAVVAANGANGGDPNPPLATSVTPKALFIAAGATTHQVLAGAAPAGFTNLIEGTNGTNPSHVMLSSRVLTNPGSLDPDAYDAPGDDTNDSWVGYTMILRPAPL